MGTTQVPAVDMTKLDTFIGQFVTDLGAAFSYWLAVFDYQHDMGDPIGAAAHVRQSLAEDGTWMIVEPVANHQLKDNLNPVAGCTIPSRRPCGRRVRGPRKRIVPWRAGWRARIRDVTSAAGFRRFHRQRRHRSMSSTKLDPDLTTMVCD
jgi:hypothetical protein